MAIRDIRAKARRDLHIQMRVPILYIYGGNPPIETFCRIHRTKPVQLGDEGLFFNAQRVEVEPKLLWWIGEDPEISINQLVRNGIVSVEEGEAYIIETVDPHDRETITTQVKRMRLDDTVGLPVP